MLRIVGVNNDLRGSPAERLKLSAARKLLLRQIRDFIFDIFDEAFAIDETIRGHVSCSFLALVLKKALEDRIAAFGRSGSWPEIVADLDSLTETEIEQDGKRFTVRSAPRSAASLAIRAAGVALPPTVREASA